LKDPHSYFWGEVTITREDTHLIWMAGQGRLESAFPRLVRLLRREQQVTVLMVSALTVRLVLITWEGTFARLVRLLLEGTGVPNESFLWRTPSGMNNAIYELPTIDFVLRQHMYQG